LQPNGRDAVFNTEALNVVMLSYFPASETDNKTKVSSLTVYNLDLGDSLLCQLFIFLWRLLQFLVKAVHHSDEVNQQGCNQDAHEK
jgi:hypothetical protein